MEIWCRILRISATKNVATYGDKLDRWKREAPMCIAVANKIINRTNAQNEWRSQNGKPRVKLTGKRLQKILYLCQLFWYIDHEESRMINEDFQAWPNGPVIPQIYDYFSVYQDGDMCPLLLSHSSSLTLEEATLVNIVVDNTIDIPTEAIIDYTHKPDGPWAKAYRDSQGVYSIISKESIKQFIRNQEHQNDLITFIQDGQNYASS